MNNKQTLEYLIGLPASGKSTYAKQIVEDSAGKTKRLNKDDLRIELHDGVYSKRNEKEVVSTERKRAAEYLKDGFNVIIDNTGFNEVHLKFYKDLASKSEVEFIVNDSFLETPLQVCIERDKQREASVGEQVVREMFHRYIKTPRTALKFDPGLPPVVICDLDGTLAHMNGKRGPFDWKKVGLDDIDPAVAHIIDAINCVKYAKVFLFSGRDSVCRPDTEEWLERNAIEYDLLAMRPKDDVRKDTIIKSEMIDGYIRGKYNILFWMDDRPVVSRMLRDEFGITVLQAGDPYTEF